MKKLPYIEFCAITLVVFLFASASHGSPGDMVWSDEYESYINQDFKHHVICRVPGSGSDMRVWSEEYEQYIPDNFPRHVIREVKVKSKQMAEIWNEEYEEYMTASFSRHVINRDTDCT